MIIEVTDENRRILDIYGANKESQLKHIYEPELGLFVAETANVILRALKDGYEAESLLLENRFLVEPDADADEATKEIYATVQEILEKIGDVPVYTADLQTLSAISGFKQTRGVLCAMKRRPLPSIDEVLKDAHRVVIMEDVENPTNVGAIFRAAAGLGMDACLLTFRSADPLYRRAARVSMGTVFQMPWTFIGDRRGGWPEPGIAELKKAGFKLVSMALSDRAVFLDDPALKKEDKLAILMGNESRGLLDTTIEQSDYIVKIPMLHGVDSLNVAAASAVACWELRRREK